MAAGALRRGGPELCGQLLELAPAARRTGDWQHGWPHLLGLFRGFALTSTPAKLGELSRVQLLHEQLGYPSLPLVHVFVAERCADVVAVALLLLVLTPAQVLGRLLALSGPRATGHSPGGRNGCAGGQQPQASPLAGRPLAALAPSPAQSGTLARAKVPAALISVLVWANEALVPWLLVRLLAPAAITIPAVLAVYLLSGKAGMASSLPGGIGVNDGTTVLLLVQQGVPTAIALPFAVLRRLIMLWSMVALAAAVGIGSQPIETQSRRDFR